ncbi:MAG: hypothetical protein ABFS45_16190 [Pseudomonadota bacterium]
MNPFAKTIVVVVIFAVPIPNYAQQGPISKTTLFAISETLAYDMGKAYQLGANCRRKLVSISKSRAIDLFSNYFGDQEVKKFMTNYDNALNEVKGRSCNLDEIRVPQLVRKIADYMRKAAPLARR